MEEVYNIFLEKFSNFTEIQKLALPIIENGSNCLVIAPTGSGKTEAALLPILSRISKSGAQGIQAIYITPLRALNRDLIKRLEDICKRAGITIGVRHGDTKYSERKAQTIKPPQLIITTPESMQSILINKSLRGAIKNIKYVIVDELHEVYYNKRGTQLAIALERLVEHSGEFQRIGISATIGDASIVGDFFFSSREYEVARVNEPKKMNIRITYPIKPKREHAELRSVFDLNSESVARIEMIGDIVKNSDSALIFANTRQVVESLGNKLIFFDRTDNFGPIAVHHGSLNQEERVNVENNFKAGKIKGIIATSSLELGIDIGSVDQVVQFNSPRQATRLVQRVGRSGHREKEQSSGTVIVGSVLDAAESIAIAEHAKAGVFESQEIDSKPYDVLMNQICSMIIEYGSLDRKKIMQIMARTSVYKNLDRKELERVIDFGIEQHLINANHELLRQGSRTIRYYYGNLSLIPNRNYFKVKNTVTNKIVSNLDENFVSSYIDIGTVFITKGLQWKAISIDEDVIYVEPSLDVEAAVPDWEGEDIPVSFEVAQRAFEIMNSSGGEDFGKYVDEEAYSMIRDLHSKQQHYRLPKKNVLLVEEQDNYIVIFAPFGKKVNEAFGKVIWSIIISHTNQEYLVRSTPYAVIVELGYTSRKLNIKSVLGSLEKVDIEDFGKTSLSLRNSEIFRYKFLQVAKVFGVIDKKATVMKSTASKLVDFYKDSPIFDETVRDLAKNYLDFGRLKHIIAMIRKGDLKIEVVESDCSPFAEEILRSAYKYRELFTALSENSKEVEQFLEGVMKKRVELYCTFCTYRRIHELSDFGEKERIKCENCGSNMVTLVKERYLDVIEKMNSDKRLTRQEMEIYRELFKIASLIDAYGVRALIALSAYGVGPETASRLLRLLRKDEKAFIIDIINAQKNFVRYKKFWK